MALRSKYNATNHANGSTVWSPRAGELSKTIAQPPIGLQLDGHADGDSVLALAMELGAMKISPTEPEREATRPSNSDIRRQEIEQWAASVSCEMDNSWDISAQEFAEAQQSTAPMRSENTCSRKSDKNDRLKWMQALCSSLVSDRWKIKS
ncbi:hypothetical protein B0H13DRAFT_1056501 [Mycena leptocephala]|nr:hypothetical protein B0H13DRAFT_1056501 [Mycena leptocephala]